jgi:uncharacterized protein YjbJ (UPF0337 family)
MAAAQPKRRHSSFDLPRSIKPLDAGPVASGTSSKARAFSCHLWSRGAANVRVCPFDEAAAQHVGVQRKESPSMNWDRIEGNWKQFTGKAKQQWGKLTDDDLTVVEGRRVELVGKIQERYGVAKDEAERQVDSWIQNM